MKQAIIIIAIIILAGCASIRDSEFLQHDTMYKNFDHMKFSMGFTDPAAVHEQSESEGWWGIPQKVE